MYDKKRMRDFVYIDDVVDCLCWVMKTMPQSGLYNIGSGVPVDFLEIVLSVFGKLGIPPDISYVEMPEKTIKSHQFFSQADILKIRSAGYDKPFTPISEGIDKYINILESK
jgi:ADP-L-glycero-D-manno-heptose 6-epimerase